MRTRAATRQRALRTYRVRESAETSILFFKLCHTRAMLHDVITITRPPRDTRLKTRQLTRWRHVLKRKLFYRNANERRIGFMATQLIVINRGYAYMYRRHAYRRDTDNRLRGRGALTADCLPKCWARDDVPSSVAPLAYLQPGPT